MIYVCIAARDHARTVGLVLWKIRQVFRQQPREYQILAVDDASADATGTTLETYQHALPLTLLRHERPAGYARSLEALLEAALARSDRLRRDVAVTLPADFSVSPAVLPELVRRFECGADVVIGESADADPSFGMRLVRRSAPWLLKPGLSIPGVKDPTSGVCAIRLITVRRCFRAPGERLLRTEGRCANAELVARAAHHARQIAVVPLAAPRHAVGAAADESPVAVAVNLFRAGRRLRIPAPAAEVQRS